MKYVPIYLIVNLLVCLVCQHTYSIQNAELPIVAITIPKCGTTLIAKCIDLLTGKSYEPIYDFTQLEDKNFVLPTHAVTVVHVPYSKQVECNLAQHNSKKFFLYRDPRDQVVSLTFWAKYTDKNFMCTLHPRLNIPLRDVEFDRLLLDFIVDPPALYTSILQFYAQYLPWSKLSDVCVIMFENLIGPKGGGTMQAQLQEIKRIAHWLGIHKTDQEIENVAHMLFGRRNFREGQIGSWRKHFMPEHKRAFKQVAGQLLIDLGYEKDLNW